MKTNQNRQNHQTRKRAEEKAREIHRDRNKHVLTTQVFHKQKHKTWSHSIYAKDLKGF